MNQHATNPTFPELLAPAGDWESMRAAVANGADAVYFGLSNFNARHRAANFAMEELPQVVQFLHDRNVLGYVTLNTLIFSEEMEAIASFVRAIAEAGADAVIVQDLGLAQLIAKLAPTLPVHGSTQMTLTEPLGIEFVHSLGVSRAILARELSKSDVARIAGETTVPLEVFVHGALCVSYSGQCLTSESLGGRSANRGQCAQACRLPYDLIVDDVKKDLNGREYLLSPQDLAAFDLIGELSDLGVACIKIEGRLKSAQYVAAATQTYRAAVDAVKKSVAFRPSEQQKLDLAQSFSRGFTHGFFDGVNHQELVHARFPKSRGVRAGKVVRATQTGLIVEFFTPLKPGDGVVLDEGRPEQDEQGGRIIAVQPLRDRRQVEIAFHSGHVNLRAVEPGCILWKTNDPEVRRRLERSYSRDRVVRPAPLSVNVEAMEGKPLVIEAIDERGRRAKVEWDRLLERAEKFPMTRAIFCQQFGRLGDTPFELGAVRVNGDANAEFPNVMIPKSVLNDLRRQATANLIAQRQSSARKKIGAGDALQTMRAEAIEIPPPETPDEPRLYALARTMEQLSAAATRCALVYCEFEDVRKYPDAVKLARDAGVQIALATLRIIKPNEHALVRSIAKSAPGAILVRNLAGLSLLSSEFPDLPLIGDYSLNVTNELTAAIFARHHLRRLTPGYDLTWRQLVAMMERFSPAWFEVVMHQHMPMFHMEHCVFAHVLSNGKDYHDCGRPCEEHRVDLRDRTGISHPLVADVGCRNTVYNGTAQSAAEYVPKMLKLGIKHFRVELLRQNGSEAKELLERYARVLSGVDSGHSTFRQLRVLNQLGVTRGTLE